MGRYGVFKHNETGLSVLLSVFRWHLYGVDLKEPVAGLFETCDLCMRCTLGALEGFVPRLFSLAGACYYNFST